MDQDRSPSPIVKTTIIGGSPKPITRRKIHPQNVRDTKSPNSATPKAPLSLAFQEESKNIKWSSQLRHDLIDAVKSALREPMVARGRKTFISFI
jgi:hypothetical protein